MSEKESERKKCEACVHYLSLPFVYSSIRFMVYACSYIFNHFIDQLFRLFTYTHIFPCSPFFLHIFSYSFIRSLIHSLTHTLTHFSPFHFTYAVSPRDNVSQWEVISPSLPSPHTQSYWCIITEHTHTIVAT